VTLHRLAFSNAYEIGALLAVLEQKSILTQAEVLDQIKAAEGQVWESPLETPRARTCAVPARRAACRGRLPRFAQRALQPRPEGVAASGLTVCDNAILALATVVRYGVPTPASGSPSR
jgi:hypothetical protein